MKNIILFLGLITSLTCYSQNSWKDVAVIEDLEIYVDTLSIERKGNLLYAQVKTVYTTENSKNFYVDKIRRSYPKQDSNLEKKMKKWNDFSYTVSSHIYDCSNKQYMITEITDYTSKAKKIIKTKTPKKNQRWLSVSANTMGDYTLYFVCDYTASSSPSEGE
ncbi:surface-adhesin E family protein [Viscerimonas tarda]